MDFFLKFSPFGILVVIKPSRIVLFIIVWNLLCGLGTLLDGGLGPFNKPISALMMAAATSYAAFCGFAPLFSENIRARWCKKGSDFEVAKFGLLMLGVTGGLLCFVSLVSFFGLLTSSS